MHILNSMDNNNNGDEDDEDNNDDDDDHTRKFMKTHPINTGVNSKTTRRRK